MPKFNALFPLKVMSLIVTTCVGYTLSAPSFARWWYTHAVRQIKQRQGGEFNQFVSQPYADEANGQHRGEARPAAILPDTLASRMLKRNTPGVKLKSRRAGLPARLRKARMRGLRKGRAAGGR